MGFLGLKLPGNEIYSQVVECDVELTMSRIVAHRVSAAPRPLFGGGGKWLGSNIVVCVPLSASLSPD
jgi:hypothetical protein